MKQLVLSLEEFISRFAKSDHRIVTGAATLTILTHKPHTSVAAQLLEG